MKSLVCVIDTRISEKGVHSEETFNKEDSLGRNRHDK